MDYRITPKAAYGQHIKLTCKDHPELSWSTKNIDRIGCRTIFYMTYATPECNCPLSKLTLWEGYKDLPDVAE
jgi:hypothetical protein